MSRPLTYAIAALARLDYVTAKAKFARDQRMECPDINTEGRLWLREARHPLLEQIFRHDDAGRHVSLAIELIDAGA